MAPKGNKKGRPPPTWLELKRIKKKSVTIADIVASTKLSQASVSRALLRYNVPWSGVEIEKRLTKLYSVAAIREAYNKAWKDYYGE